MFIDLSYGYQSDEAPFIKYFQRLKSIGMDRNEIKNKLPQLLSYYEDMVKWGEFDSFHYKNMEEKLNGLYETFAGAEFYGDWNK